ncbi:MAG: sulfurtransferase TusA family protein [Burkholderia sp.]|nr:sulfurtransferase TusA family protein [Burkholderia sp.]
MQINKEVNVCGLNCPLPILRVKIALSDMTSGQILKILATDPNLHRDFIKFANQTGNEIIEFIIHGEVFVFLIRRR